MTNQDVIDYYVTEITDNDDRIDSIMAVLNGVIDELSSSDRTYIKEGLSAEGVDIAESICRRDE
jgi:hypothetical protein